MSSMDTRRAKILGDLIRQARLNARHSVEDCAQALGITAAEFEQAESGDYDVSLPDLEVLAIYLQVPMGYFWGSEPLKENDNVSYSEFIDLRHRVIGVLLRQSRLRARRSKADMAEAIGVEEAVIDTYESGHSPIPFLHLEQLSKFLDTTIVHFVDDERGPLARHEAEQRLLKQFANLSPELQVFITKPGNESYLETAKRISDMDVEKLRDLAAGILDITF